MGIAGSDCFICEHMMGSIAHGGRRANQACFRNTPVAPQRNNQDKCPPVARRKTLGRAVDSTTGQSWLYLYRPTHIRPLPINSNFLISAAS